MDHLYLSIVLKRHQIREVMSFMSFVIRIILSSFTFFIYEISIYEKHDLDINLNIISVTVITSNLSRQYVAGIGGVYFFLRLVKIIINFFELNGIIPLGFHFHISITICEGALLYLNNNSSSTLSTTLLIICIPYEK